MRRTEEGQTAVEYLLLLAAVAVMLFSLFSHLRQRMFLPASECAKRPTAVSCQLRRIFGPGNFQYFRLIR